MTWGGWIGMSFAVGLTSFLFAWCCWKSAFGVPNETERNVEDDEEDKKERFS